LSNANNKQGTLAWGQSYIFSACLKLYQNTGDFKYIETFCAQAANVLQQRDSLKGNADYLGRSGPVWVSERYTSEEKPYVFAVHSGMITLPFFDFGMMVKEDPQLASRKLPDGTRISEFAEMLQTEGLKAINFHQNQWDEDEQAYSFLNNSDLNFPGELLPYNMQSVMGACHLELFKLTGDSLHFFKARSLANYFYDAIQFDSLTGFTTWLYQPGAGPEDLSHAELNISFARRCAEYGLVFEWADIEAMARTIALNCLRNPGRFWDRIDGSGSTGNFDERAVRLLLLADVEPNLYYSISEVVAPDAVYKYDNIRSGNDLLGLALAHIHEGHITPLARHRDLDVNYWGNVILGDFDGDNQEEILALSNDSGRLSLFNFVNGKLILVRDTLLNIPASEFRLTGAKDNSRRSEDIILYHKPSGHLGILNFKNGFIQSIYQGLPESSTGTSIHLLKDQYSWVFWNPALDFFTVKGRIGDVWISQIQIEKQPGTGLRQIFQIPEGGYIALTTNAELFLLWHGQNPVLLTMTDADGNSVHPQLIARGEFYDFNGEEWVIKDSLCGDLFFYRLEGNQFHFVSQEFFPSNYRLDALNVGRLGGSPGLEDAILITRNIDQAILVYSTASESHRILLDSYGLEMPEESNILVTPNPATGQFYLNILDPNFYPNEISVIDHLGQILLKLDLNGIGNKNPVELDMGGHDPGTYILQVTDGREIYIRKIVLR
jgi:hypothetical protein